MWPSTEGVKQAFLCFMLPLASVPLLYQKSFIRSRGG
ncbi:hypothetical protein E2C01_030528 [Portunus trituberculatus]|uniref:Uncharacterized protein n=1 Tax=Portunus trituberculatus TaxID=210409 RepID=A0A5B7EUG8_PORTR|nr:hypothetical protein [Portunus trituberculatus]